MKNDERRNGGFRPNRDMKGAARRTYPVRGEEKEENYRGNNYRSDRSTPRGNAPRVGAVYQNVPAAQRVGNDAAPQERPRRDFDRKP
ncbi:MAG: hypothetical protein J6M10_08210, partial [Clostridia bacterium]|nr:hypothetical protein [Clostridia bacterium]